MIRKSFFKVVRCEPSPNGINFGVVGIEIIQEAVQRWTTDLSAIRTDAVVRPSYLLKTQGVKVAEKTAIRPCGVA